LAKQIIRLIRAICREEKDQGEFSARSANFLLPIEGSTFSGQVSAIEARDAAIFTKNINSLADHG
jgi:hypothetical protein